MHARSFNKINNYNYSYSFVGYNNKENPHMLNTVHVPLEVVRAWREG